jgi:hypothetical protein
MLREALEILMERISTWPEQVQSELVQSLEAIESKHVGPYRLTDDECAAIRRGLDEMRHGRLASEDAVTAVFNRYPN